MARNQLSRINNTSGHEYNWDSMCKVWICHKCGTAEHKNGDFYLQGYKSKTEPPCAYETSREKHYSDIEFQNWKDNAIFDGL